MSTNRRMDEQTVVHAVDTFPQWKEKMGGGQFG